MDRKKLLRISLQFLNDDVTESAAFFSDYIKKTELSIIQGQKDLEKKVEDIIKAHPEWEPEEIQEGFEEEGRQHYNFNPNLLYNSIFITQYSYFENRLKEVAINFDNLYDNLGKHPKQGIIFAYKKYLQDNPYYDFLAVENEWNTILDFNKIRNNIVHSNGFLDDEDTKTPELIEVLKKYPSIEVWGKTVRIKDSKILMKFNDTIHYFLAKVITEITIP